jgi:hypothetical protein
VLCDEWRYTYNNKQKFCKNLSSIHSIYWITAIYRVRINWRNSLRYNLSRKRRKIVKCMSITQSEHKIWNGPIVATAISREERKPVLEGNDSHRPSVVGVSWNLPPRSPDLTVCDFFLWGSVKDNVYVPPLPKTLPELRERINTAIGNVTQDMLERVCR